MKRKNRVIMLWRVPEKRTKKRGQERQWGAQRKLQEGSGLVSLGVARGKNAVVGGGTKRGETVFLLVRSEQKRKGLARNGRRGEGGASEENAGDERIKKKVA